MPEVWECTVCGAEALRIDGTRPEPKKGKPARTHWDMLLERRSVKELEVLLAERLEQLLRAGTAEVDRRTATSARAPDHTSCWRPDVRVAPLPPGGAARTCRRSGALREAPARRGRPPP